MHHSLELLDRALATKKQARWVEQLNVSRATFSQAKKRGRLSPTLAANLAIGLGADAIYWTAIAAAEAEPDSHLKDVLIKTLERHKTAL